jgi:hypothetical protein
LKNAPFANAAHQRTWQRQHVLFQSSSKEVSQNNGTLQHWTQKASHIHQIEQMGVNLVTCFLAINGLGLQPSVALALVRTCTSCLSAESTVARIM